MTKSESKYFNTAILMDKALIELLSKKDFEYITVKEICESAGVNRSTFYLHYEGISDLLIETTEYIFDQFDNVFDENIKDVAKNIKEAEAEDLIFINHEILESYLTFIKSNKTVIKATFKNPKCMITDHYSLHIYKYILEPIYLKFGIPNEEIKYMISYYINGLMAIVKEWINGDCKDSIALIEKVMINCIRPNDAFSKK